MPFCKIYKHSYVNYKPILLDNEYNNAKGLKGSVLQTVLKIIKENSKNLNSEFKRLFHGRGKCFEGFEDITVDSINNILFVQVYKEIGYKDKLLSALQEYIKTSPHDTLLFKSRYDNKLEVVSGKLEEENFAVENGMKFLLDFTNQNIGYFGDMKNGRAFVESVAEGKKVLNLFAYSCGFSLFAKRGGASRVINVDMSKGALARGMKNHTINGLAKGVSYWHLDILKSFPKLKREAPYDIIILDPPTFQRGSFEIEKDYEKIVKKLPSLLAEDGLVISALNTPYLDYGFLDDLYKKHTDFVKIKEIEPVREYCNKEPKEGLKIAVYRG